MSYWITFHDGSQACFELDPKLAPEPRKTYAELKDMPLPEVKEYHELMSAELMVTIDSEIANLDLNKQVVNIQRLPYPAEPRIGPYRSGTPAFCMSPKTCAGWGACPRSYACTE